MATITRHAEIGDLIRSDKFAYGTYQFYGADDGQVRLDRLLIEVDGGTKNQPVSYLDPDSTHRNPKYITLDIGAYDPSRGTALFVVEEAMMAGGGMAMFNDRYEDGWQVHARRLTHNGEYNPNGEMISFYQSGCFTNNIGEVERVGKMKKVFVR